MLVKRIITALALAPIIILALFYLSDNQFALFWGAFILLAAWEWTNLAGVNRLIGKLVFISLLVITMTGVMYWTTILEYLAAWTDNVGIYQYSGILDWFVIGPVLWWLLAMVLIRNTAGALLKMKIKTGYKMLLGWFILISAWMFLARLRMLYPIEIVLYFLLLIWAADIAAFFAGKKFGLTKLAPEISPGKTVAGMYGAIISALVCGLCLSLYYSFSWIITIDFVILSMFTVLTSIYGDLFISLFKRIRGVKDSGTLLPGHGGFLDRMDSMIAATPVFYLGILLLEVS